MKNAMLVALRELVENVRTKGFWIGLFIFPVAIVALIGISVLFALAKDVRKYAVIDHSGWLLPAVEDRATYYDMQRLLELVRDKARAGESEIAKLPTQLQALGRQMKDASDDQVEEAARAMAARAGLSLAGVAGAPSAPAALLATAEGSAGDVMAWMATLKPEEARKLDSGLTRSRYQRQEIPAGTPDEEAWAKQELAKKNGLFAYFVVGEDPVKGNEGSKYVSNNATDEDLRNWLSRLATAEVEQRRFQAEGVAREIVERIQQPLVFEAKRVSAGGKEGSVSVEEQVRQHAPMAFSYLLYLTVLITASKLLTNTIEEKSLRIMEVLLSSITPLELMVGKVIGTASTGLAIVMSWVLFAAAGVLLLPLMLAGKMPFDLGAVIGDPRFVVSFVVYFVCGYLLYAALLVAIGSVCNSIQEAQNLMAPLNIVMALPMLALFPVTRDPNGMLAKVLSFVPLFTPFVMMNRAAGPPETWEYVATSAVLIVSLVVMFWMAAKIFRIGVLMTGKPPKLREILGWLRAPVGAMPARKDPP